VVLDGTLFALSIPANKNIVDRRFKQMDTFTAIGIAEGFIEAESQEQVIDAWQYLIDTGLAWQLQGWFGRTASHLIGEGVCQEPDRNRPARAAIEDAYK
jgi:hypothetical protein